MSAEVVLVTAPKGILSATPRRWIRIRGHNLILCACFRKTGNSAAHRQKVVLSKRAPDTCRRGKTIGENFNVETVFSKIVEQKQKANSPILRQCYIPIALILQDNESKII